MNLRHLFLEWLYQFAVPSAGWDSVSPTLLQRLLSVVLLIFAILTEVKRNLKVILVCISLIPRDSEHFIEVSLSLSPPLSFENFLSKFQVQFLKMSLKQKHK